MGDPTGEADKGTLRLDFDRRLLLQFRGSTITSDAGLLAYRELDEALSLTDTGANTLADARTGKNGRHRLAGLLRQSVFGRLAGYEDVNDAERLCRDQPAREADQDRREGHQSRALRDLPAGRGRGGATDVRRHPVADRPAPGTAHPGMSGAEVSCDKAITAEVQPDEGQATSSNAPRRPIQRFGRQHRQMRSNLVAARLNRTENHPQQPRNLGNVS
jgi:hypothetical protein